MKVNSEIILSKWFRSLVFWVKVPYIWAMTACTACDFCHFFPQVEIMALGQHYRWCSMDNTKMSHKAMTSQHWNWKQVSFSDGPGTLIIRYTNLWVCLSFFNSCGGLVGQNLMNCWTLTWLMIPFQVYDFSWNIPLLNSRLTSLFWLSSFGMIC